MASLSSGFFTSSHVWTAEEIKESLALVHARTVLTCHTPELSNIASTRSFYVDSYDSSLRWIPVKDEKKHKCLVSFDLVNRVQLGFATVNFHQAKMKNAALKEDSCFSIIYKGISLDLEAENATIAQRYVLGISELIKRSESGNEAAKTAMLYTYWSKYDRDESGQLDQDEVLKLLENLNVDNDKKSLKELMKKLDTDKTGNIDFNEFSRLYDTFAPDEFQSLFKKYCNPVNETMSVEEFLKFLRAEQGDVIEIQTAVSMIESIHLNFPLNKFKFYNFLRSSINSFRKPYSPPLNFPLSDYFMASSHNTYLEGDQLTSNSSSNQYINAFMSGCRCVELDCWDGPNGTPIIYHGHTLTSVIEFRDVIIATRKFGFAVNSNPICLSLENHCSESQQKIMAEYILQELGDVVVILHDNPYDCQKLPSLDELQYKILLKGKGLSKSKSKAPGRLSVAEKKPLALVTALSRSMSRAVEVDDNKEPTVALIDSLSSLIYLSTTKAPKNLPEEIPSNDDLPYWEMVSYSENDIASKISKHAVSYSMLNSHQLSRIYPGGLRMDSSNYDPVPSWYIGSQIVALNYQTFDEFTLINRGLFADVSSGYVLKPEFLRSPNPKTHPLVSVPAASYRLKIDVISGMGIPKADQSDKGDIVDPYVVLSLRGVPADNCIWSTQYVENNGFHPVWNESTSFVVRVWDLSFLTFMVYDKDAIRKDTVLCGTSIPLSRLQKGYRYVPMMNKFFKNIPFCGINIRVDIERL